MGIAGISPWIDWCYHEDLQGTILATSGAPDGFYNANFHTDSWGNLLTGWAANNPYLYLGGLGYWEDDNFVNLKYVRSRWLDPTIGQWLSVDPVASEPRYAYAHNSPTMRTDASGTDDEKWPYIQLPLGQDVDARYLEWLESVVPKKYRIHGYDNPSVYTRSDYLHSQFLRSEYIEQLRTTQLVARRRAHDANVHAADVAHSRSLSNVIGAFAGLVNIKANAALAALAIPTRDMRWQWQGLWFQMTVRTRRQGDTFAGWWDYKNREDLTRYVLVGMEPAEKAYVVDKYGNYHYGYVSAAAGIPDRVSIAGAGEYHRIRSDAMLQDAVVADRNISRVVAGVPGRIAASDTAYIRAQKKVITDYVDFPSEGEPASGLHGVLSEVGSGVFPYGLDPAAEYWIQRGLDDYHRDGPPVDLLTAGDRWLFWAMRASTIQKALSVRPPPAFQGADFIVALTSYIETKQKHHPYDRVDAPTTDWANEVWLSDTEHVPHRAPANGRAPVSSSP